MKYDYETIDWELEAKRVSRAFEVGDGCYFQSVCEADGEGWMWLRLTRDNSPPILPSNEWLSVIYTRKVRSYSVVIPFMNWAVAESEFTWDNELGESVFTGFHALMLARAFLRLGLLTPIIEAELWALMADNSAHEKLEWKLEYETKAEI